MNKELIENFRWAAKEEKSPSNISYTFTPQQLEKFAELIVKECLTIMDQQWLDGHEVGQAANDIEKHFGI